VGNNGVLYRKAWVTEAIGEGNANGEDVGSRVTVGGTVFVIVGAIAVWVRKKAAANVCAPAATVPLISCVGSPAAWPPQDVSNIPISNNGIHDRRTKFIIHLV
jgi:hypothetical protein